ncbi:MAG: DUF86 domain-containing protein [Planctomycetes bacterium]|nr:DUF86 domain-containing protein [Planctomycetota bacterium]
MSPIDRDVVRRKVERIRANLRHLEPFQSLTIKEYLADDVRRAAVERFLQVTVEAAVDINSHLLVETGLPAPDDQHSSFISAGQHGIIDADLAHQMAPSTGLRNRLVHEYDKIDDAKVLASVGTALDLFPRYIAAVERFLAANA